MHELSIAQSILTIAKNAVPQNCNASVSSVGLQIGELSSIEIESLEFAFSVLKVDTIFKNAELNIELVKGEAECNECKTVFPARSYISCCPDCHSFSKKIIMGREMRVLNIVVEE